MKKLTFDPRLTYVPFVGRSSAILELQLEDNQRVEYINAVQVGNELMHQYVVITETEEADDEQA